jgi:16S rRNA (uracil1498-N3)-methyltransferase
VSGADDTAAVRWSGGPLVFVDDLETPILSEDDHHHLARVRRVRDGDELVLADGRGRWRDAKMAGSHPEPSGALHLAPRQSPEIGVGFALVKGHKPELVVQKLTELGVDRIVAFVAARSVVRWDDAKAEANAERWRKVAREAAMQSRRAWLPVVESVTTWTELASRSQSCRAEPGGGPPSLDHPLILIGPEGGWDDTEARSEMATVGLGDGVLRAETAAISAGVVLSALRAGLVGPGGQ